MQNKCARSRTSIVGSYRQLGEAASRSFSVIEIFALYHVYYELYGAAVIGNAKKQTTSNFNKKGKHAYVGSVSFCSRNR